MSILDDPCTTARHAGLPGSLTAAAESLRPDAFRRAAEADRLRGLDAALTERLTGSGFARHFVPRRWGGAEGSFTELVAATAALAEGCTSTAWCAALQAAHGRLAAFLPEAGQQEIWGDSPDVPIAAALVPPTGRLERTADGGALITGNWRCVSGVGHAVWVLLALPDPAALPGDFLIVAVPRAAVTVHDTWHSNGLRGTGSHDVSVTEPLAVPPHRCVGFMDLVRASAATDRARCHGVPPRLVAGLAFAAPAVGAARGALKAWAAPLADAHGPGGPAVSPARCEVMARASAEIDIAASLLADAALRADTGAVGDRAVGRNLRDTALAVELTVSAVERLFRAGGVAAQWPDSALQRAWRDVHSLAAHGALNWDAAAAEYTRTGLAAFAG
ncbi:alkylation response protein AidB-like acyl-CoA dehydrogenase [Streptomyces sp. TLI_235]|nr:oxidoreductase [Streptomyces sp. TLI_235]PBC78697.1 alkylation response protein AidB-like acyl-CoA dehydrogenase [Streptomyces sp. TLI_235]